MRTCLCGCGKLCKKNYVHGHNRQGIKYNSKLKNTGKIRISWNGYLIIKLNGKYQKLHRLIYEAYYKCKLLPYVELDHINQNKLDNRIENLRPFYKSQHAKLSAKQKRERLRIDKRICLLCNKRYKGDWYKFQNGFICRPCYKIQYRLMRKNR